MDRGGVQDREREREGAPPHLLDCGHLLRAGAGRVRVQRLGIEAEELLLARARAPRASFDNGALTLQAAPVL